MKRRCTKTRLRPIRNQDRGDLLVWRNDIDTRKQSVNTRPVPYREHEEWFSRNLGSRNIRIYESNRALGVIRKNTIFGYELSWTINPTERGKGHGYCMLNKYLKEIEDDPFFIVRIKIGNKPSIRIAEKNGFKKLGTVRGYGIYARIGKGFAV